MSKTIMFFADYKTKTIEFVECEYASAKPLKSDSTTMLTEIKGGIHDGEKLICSGLGDMGFYLGNHYKDFTVGKIVRVAPGEATEQCNLFGEEKL